MKNNKIVRALVMVGKGLVLVILSLSLAMTVTSYVGFSSITGKLDSYLDNTVYKELGVIQSSVLKYTGVATYTSKLRLVMLDDFERIVGVGSETEDVNEVLKAFKTGEARVLLEESEFFGKYFTEYYDVVEEVFEEACLIEGDVEKQAFIDANEYKYKEQADKLFSLLTLNTFLFIMSFLVTIIFLVYAIRVGIKFIYRKFKNKSNGDKVVMVVEDAK